jgi:hypothetical protein
LGEIALRLGCEGLPAPASTSAFLTQLWTVCVDPIPSFEAPIQWPPGTRPGKTSVESAEMRKLRDVEECEANGVADTLTCR